MADHHVYGGSYKHLLLFITSRETNQLTAGYTILGQTRVIRALTVAVPLEFPGSDMAIVGPPVYHWQGDPD